LDHPLQCRCGTLVGRVAGSAFVNRGVCYCRDCQAFAHFLGEGSEILDDLGGTEIIQTLPRHVTFSRGVDSLACMRLTENGLLRWYANCCHTPIGNTPANPRLSFVGLVHSCLRAPGVDFDRAFGPIHMRVNTKSARPGAAPKQVGVSSTVLRFVVQLVKSRVDGSYRITPFFDANRGTPIATPRVLSREELDRIRTTL
jgi:hypothetical protein